MSQEVSNSHILQAITKLPGQVQNRSGKHEKLSEQVQNLSGQLEQTEERLTKK